MTIGDRLQEVVYEALETLCQGFLRFDKNGLDPNLHLKLAYDNSLILLYRLLFILYAESRSLLPLDTNKSYREKYSLEHLKREIAKQIDREEVIPYDWSSYWANLKALSNAINHGSKSLDIYEYNGGLFDPKQHEFLEHNEISDHHHYYDKEEAPAIAGASLSIELL